MATVGVRWTGTSRWAIDASTPSCAGPRAVPLVRTQAHREHDDRADRDRREQRQAADPGQRTEPVAETREQVAELELAALGDRLAAQHQAGAEDGPQQRVGDAAQHHVLIQNGGGYPADVGTGLQLEGITPCFFDEPVVL